METTSRPAPASRSVRRMWMLEQLLTEKKISALMSLKADWILRRWSSMVERE